MACMKAFGSRRVFALFSLLLGGAVLTSGCESKEEANLAKAQACLDKATPETVSACPAMVANDTSSKAYLIRCAAHYIENGFVGTTIANAFESIKNNNNGGSVDAMGVAFRFMAFKTMDAANQTLSDCQKSGVRSMERLATFTSMATLIGTVGGATIPDGGMSEAEVQSRIANFVANGGDVNQLGQVAVQAEEAYCNEGSAFEKNEVCKNLSAAVGSGKSLSEIGQELLNQLQPH